MSNSTARDGDITRLHPMIRAKVAKIRETLHKEGHAFEVFEAFRTPERQNELYAKGRTKPGSKVTWVEAWGSIHQYGLAVDFVLKENGKWSWKTSGDYMDKWLRMHEVAAKHGLVPLRSKTTGKLIELPHLQPEGISASALKRGEYPEGGDDVWADHLSMLIDNWSGGGAPPKPLGRAQAPGLDQDAVAEMEAEAARSGLASETDNHALGVMADAKFQRLHGFVKHWEGGFVNHPEDNGGPTNMGITQATLADWRKTDVSIDDVRNLTRAEADEIFRANYYTRCRCGELPDRTAMVVYNGAVLHGSRRSIRYLQTAFNKLGMTVDGKALEVDGILGPKTLAGAKQTDSGVLAGAYMDVQDSVFRAHEDFDTFGNGWLNRLGALRDFIEKLPKGAGKRPKKIMKVSNRFDLDKEDLLRVALAAATGGKSAVLGVIAGEILKKDDDTSATEAAVKDFVREAIEDKVDLPPEPIAPAQPAPVTRINGALGQTVGRALDGKKTIIGILSLLATALLPSLGLTTEDAGEISEILKTFNEGGSHLQTSMFTIASIVTGWGFLGKIDKLIQEARAIG